MSFIFQEDCFVCNQEKKRCVNILPNEMVGKIILEFIINNDAKKILSFPCFWGIHCTFNLKHVNAMKLVMRGFELEK